MTERYELFENTITKNHETIVSNLRSILNVVGNLKIDQETRIKQIQVHINNLIETGNLLNRILRPEDLPDWLGPLLSSSKKYIQNGYEAKNFIHIYEILPKAINHKWNFKTELKGINFDSIYQTYKNTSKLPELLDEIIRLLTKLIKENGEELQKKTLDDLTRLLNTVIENKNSSSAAIETTLLLIFDFFKNTFFTLFPVIKITANGIETIKEIGKLVHDSLKENDELRKQVLDKTNSSFSNSIYYSKEGNIIEESILPKIVDEHYIDSKI